MIGIKHTRSFDFNKPDLFAIAQECWLIDPEAARDALFQIVAELQIRVAALESRVKDQPDQAVGGNSG